MFKLNVFVYKKNKAEQIFILYRLFKTVTPAINTLSLDKNDFVKPSVNLNLFVTGIVYKKTSRRSKLA